MKLKGKRVTLRPLMKKDEKRIAELAHDKSIYRFTRVPYPYKIAYAKKFISDSQGKMKEKEEYVFAITLNEDDELIGTASLMRFDRMSNRAEVGYWLGKPYRNKGYVPEACKLIINFGFSKLKLNKIIIECAKENTASKKVIDKLGAKLEGVLRESSFVGGRYRDSLYHGILRKEWKPDKIRV